MFVTVSESVFWVCRIVGGQFNVCGCECVWFPLCSIVSKVFLIVS